MRNIGLLGCVGALLLVLLIVGGFFVSTRNNLVGLDEDVNKSWAQVESQYQRRYDLIPNLVRTVEGAANFEKSTLEAVVNARARVGQVQMNAPTDPAAMAQFEQAQGALTGALQRLLVVVEQYPDLKSNANFRDLQAQLEGTENRIAVARQNFNDSAQQYNTAIRRFPASMIAGMSGFKQRPYFKTTSPDAQNAPNVDFNFNTSTTTAPAAPPTTTQPAPSATTT
jgi:LemA protein